MSLSKLYICKLFRDAVVYYVHSISLLQTYFMEAFAHMYKFFCKFHDDGRQNIIRDNQQNWQSSSEKRDGVQEDVFQISPVKNCWADGVWIGQTVTDGLQIPKDSRNYWATSCWCGACSEVVSMIKIVSDGSWAGCSGWICLLACLVVLSRIVNSNLLATYSAQVKIMCTYRPPQAKNMM